MANDKPKRIAVIAMGNIGNPLGKVISDKIADSGLTQNLVFVSDDEFPGINTVKQLAEAHGLYVNISGGAIYEGIEGSDIVVISAVNARKPGMTKEELAKWNLKSIQTAFAEVNMKAQDAVVIIITSASLADYDVLTKLNQNRQMIRLDTSKVEAALELKSDFPVYPISKEVIKTIKSVL